MVDFLFPLFESLFTMFAGGLMLWLAQRRVAALRERAEEEQRQAQRLREQDREHTAVNKAARLALHDLARHRLLGGQSPTVNTR